MSVNLKPLQDAVKLVADVVLDSVNAAEQGGGVAAEVGDFANILSDLVVLLPEVGMMPSPSSLSPEDYAALVASLGADLVVPGKAGAVVEASLKLLGDLAAVIVPDVMAIIAASKS